MDINKPEYENRVAAWVTGVNVATLQTWANRGLISAAQSAPGQGRRRLYSIRGLIAVALASRVVALGISASLASAIARSITGFADFTGDPETCPTLILTRAIMGVLHFKPVHTLEELPALLAPGNFQSDVYVLVYVKDIVQTVWRRLADLEDAKKSGLI